MRTVVCTTGVGSEPVSRRMPHRAAKNGSTTSGATSSTRSVTRDYDGPMTRRSMAHKSLIPNFGNDSNGLGKTVQRSNARNRKRPVSGTASPSKRRQPKRLRHSSGDYHGSSEDEQESDDIAAVQSSSAMDGENEKLRKVTTLVQSPLRSKRTNGINESTKIPGYSPTEHRSEGKGNEFLCPQQARIPPWNELPYFILMQIFDHAVSAELDRHAANWLLSTSRVCRAFAEPALTVLYKHPPLYSLPMAHGLVYLLSQSPDHTLFSYRTKVERLSIDVGTVAMKTHRGNTLDFKILLQNVPRLRELHLWHDKDNPPYRQLDEKLRWCYPRSLFEGLGVRFPPLEDVNGPFEVDENVVRLSSWRWSSRMIGPGLNWNRIRALHETPCFNDLRRVAFVNFQLPSLHAANAETPEMLRKDMEMIADFAGAIRALPNLRHLIIESSTVANEHLLPLLPDSIEHLELINCWDVKSSDFSGYLLSHGHRLRHLTLHHNQSLNLAFLPVLGLACPALESLSMNLTYFKHHEFYSDSDPGYDRLLTSGQVPVWPSSLRSLDLKNLRYWDADAADTFFQSLADSAPTLPLLRRLVIKAMLDIPFRQRSQMRDKWVAQLTAIFLRQFKEPLPIYSLHSKNAREEAAPSRQRFKPKHGNKYQSSSPTARRSNRIATRPFESPLRVSGVSRSLRYMTSNRLSYAEPETDDGLESEVDEEESGVDEGNTKELPSMELGRSLLPRAGDLSLSIQGLCDVVDITFDNQKPVEHPWQMGDFLDSESDDPTDEDWNGDRDDDDDYAW
ncbi:hypothetical protein VTK73DRAFT_107 [Phialemonium thermophilum]|uniref:F-box domain-containing protein n=1 Tax=Phialemonium thermophilum TaxID=223376 RepID=A0ABR3Y5F1_9PEZI